MGKGEITEKARKKNKKPAAGGEKDRKGKYRKMYNNNVKLAWKKIFFEGLKRFSMENLKLDVEIGVSWKIGLNKGEETVVAMLTAWIKVIMQRERV